MRSFFVLAALSTAQAFAPVALAPRKSFALSVSYLEGLSTNGAASTTVATTPSVAQRWRKSTKQVATLGPASSNFEMIEKLFLAGADVFRLNFSHVRVGNLRNVPPVLYSLNCFRVRARYWTN